MRKYESTWIALKTSPNKSIELTIPRDSHERLIDALRKESSRDFAFRFKYVEEGKHYNIGVTQLGDWIKFTIDEKSGTPDSFILSPEKVQKRKRWEKKYVNKFLSESERAALLGNNSIETRNTK